MNSYERLKYYERALSDYRLSRLLPFLKKFLSTDKGFCNHITNYNAIFWGKKFKTFSERVNLNELSELTELAPRQYDPSLEFQPYWYKPGKLLPRIKLLKAAIRNLKRENEIKVRNENTRASI